MSAHVSSLAGLREANRAHRYAGRLLDDVAPGRTLLEFDTPHPAIDWAASGAMWLTGHAGAAPRLAPVGIVQCAHGALAALRALAAPHALGALDACALLSERAAHFPARRQGRVSAGGRCRLMPSRDGWIALNLARPEDCALLPAWFEDPDAGRHGPQAAAIDGDESSRDALWAYAARHISGRTSSELLFRGRLLGLPIAADDDDGPTPNWCRIAADGSRVARSADARPRVVDLSSLWAGPLCTHLLALAGAEVVKVESSERPDGARAGPGGFFDLLHAGKRSVAVDVRATAGRRRLRQLIASADIVVESSRPRALQQFGIDAEAWVAARPGLTWLSITGYGRAEPEAQWVAFGDDAAVAAGLARAVGDATGPLFCADAIADPLTGLHAAVAALGSFLCGGGRLLDLSLRGVAASVLAHDPDLPTSCRVEATRRGDWEVVIGRERHPIRPPRSRVPRQRAAAFGADTAAELERLDRDC